MLAPTHALKATIAITSLLALSACNAPGQAGQATGQVLGSDDVNDAPAPVPSNLPTPAPTHTDPTPTAVGPSCHSSDATKICLSLKVVAYVDANAQTVLTEDEAIANVAGINRIWSQCGVAFEIGEFDMVNPVDKGLRYSPKDLSELGTARANYVDAKTMLIVTTGEWDRSGTLGDSGANAWTSMPGGQPYGVVLEASSATYYPIIAHELGHYLNLDHVSDVSDVMNPVIYTTSTKLTASQCTAARAAAAYWWTAMYR